MPRPSRSSSARRSRSIRVFAVRLLLVASLLAAVSATAIGALALREIRKDLPPVEQLAGYRPAVASQVYAAGGELVGEFFLEKRYLVALDRIPPVVRQAFVAAEDSGFYHHRGIDLMSILRAFATNLFAGEVVQGGSTITQQVVKSLLLTPEKSYERKLKEILLSLRLERQLSKDEILYLYLNQIYLGSGAYGVAAAAQVYFDKAIEDLTLPEAALLAGLPQAPSRTSPIHHPERARARQLYVLERMEADGYITRAQGEQAAAIPVPVVIGQRRESAQSRAPDFVEHVRRQLEDRYGNRAPYELGLRIDTALDLRLQQIAERAVLNGLKALDRRRGYRGPMRSLSEAEAQPFLDRQQRAAPRGGYSPGTSVEALVVRPSAERVLLRIGGSEAVLPAAEMSWASPRQATRFRPGDVILVRIEKPAAGGGSYEVSLDEHPEVEGAFLAMDPNTGYVRAMVGGYDYSRSQFNRAVQAYRQPGSAFKPLVYAAALDRGYTPATIVVDSPIVFDDGSNRVWKPENYEQEFHGPTRLREALVHSMNVATVKVAQDIGLPYLISYLPRFGFERPFPRNLSIALGSSEVTLLELVRAYDAFASGGKVYQPIFVTRITDGAGNVVEERRPSSQDALSPETAYLITSILQSVIDRGTGRRARVLRRPAAGKTGTTNDQMDAWFVGYTPDLLAGAWVGFDEKKSLGREETGGRAAVPIWTEFMEGATERMPITDFPIPPGVVFVNIDGKTGLRPAPGDGNVTLECFRRGTEPEQIVQRAQGPAPDDFFRGDF
ncbi:MAG: PBP1A family penicillin-binding protein [Deltaproteobacteria bacterium]|nr:PBP1A family penicillin-binding protein [Deltaproteobacteria bacterium]